ncbi:MAG: autotransporter-associated beta strand repeat-containing protein, partial [Kiritimatiellae bacterium]|nr:autotransporter-associated beta strand repeat-containing protein [Kiritimatiellia bacterium]
NNNYLVANNLEKSGPGTVTLSAANEYTGTTFVRDGVLELTGSLAGTAWVEGGTLTGAGAIAGYVYVAGGAIQAASGASLTLGDNLAVGPGGRLAVSGTDGTPGVLSLTKPGALLHIDEGAEIDFLVKGSGGIGSLKGEHVIVEMPEGGNVVGEFAGFTDGKAVDRFGNRYTIRYDAGDGNDIALTGLSRGTVILLK